MKTEDNLIADTCEPAAITPALHNKLLAAMMSTKADVAQDAAVEATLRRLSPSPLTAPQLARLDASVYDAQQLSRSPYSRSWLGRAFGHWQKLAALLVLFCICAGFTASYYVFDEDDSASLGLATRRVFTSKAVREIKWDGVQSKSEFEVLYEDSFVYSGDDDTTIIVTVPNRTTVSLEVTSI